LNTQNRSIKSVEDAPLETPQGAPGLFNTSKVLAVASGHFVHDMFTGFLAPLLPLIIEKLGLSLALAGVLAAMQQLPSLIDPLLGVLADRGKLRWLVILSPLMSAAGMCLLGLAPTYTMLLLLLISVGLSSAIWHTATPVWTARCSGRQVGKGMSFYMIGGEGARTLSPLIAVAAVSWWGLDGIWRLLPLPLASSVLLYWQLRDIDGCKAVERTVVPDWKTSWQSLRRVLIPAIGIMLTQAFIQSAFNVYLPTYIAAQGASLWLAGASLTIYQAAGVTGVLLAGMWSDRLGRRKILLAVLLASPLLMFLFLATTGWLRIVALVGVGFCVLSIGPVLLAIVQENSRDHPATGNGLYLTSTFTGRSLILILVGVMADQMGMQAAFTTCAWLGFLALPFAWMLPRDE
jgi:FSR family fosmidomycin resistance protein-like MFS transporter